MIEASELMPTLNSDEYYHFNEVPLDVEITVNGGTGLVWDFTELSPIDPELMGYSYVAPEDTEYYNDFTDAEYAVHILASGVGNAYAYYSINTEYIIELGEASSFGVTNTFPIKICALPIQLGNNVDEYDFYNDGDLRWRHSAQTNGSGTLNLPGGVSYNDVFLTSTQLHLDSWEEEEWYTESSQNNFSFYKAGFARPILEILNFYVDGEYDETAFWYYAGNTNQVEEANSNKWSIYPNPATDQLNIQSELQVESTQVAIFNIYGKLVSSQIITGSFSTLDISNLSAGIYVLSLKNSMQTINSQFQKK